MRHIFYIVILLLSSCSDEASFSTPAQSHINEYMDGLKSCQDDHEAQDNASPHRSSSTLLDTKIDPSFKQKSKDSEVIDKTSETELAMPAAKTESTPIAAEAELAMPAIKAEPIKSSSLDINDNDIVLGNRTSKVVFIEYFSPTCPHCAYYHKNIFPAIKKKYLDTNRIAYVIREFVGNKQDLDAAILARCKGNDDSFIKFTNVILQQQESWSLTNKYREILTNIGQLGGVSPKEYAECLGNNKLAELLITNSKIAAKSSKFVGTPAFFINSLQFAGIYSVEGISEIIDKELAQN